MPPILTQIVQSRAKKEVDNAARTQFRDVVCTRYRASSCFLYRKTGLGRGRSIAYLCTVHTKCWHERSICAEGTGWGLSAPGGLTLVASGQRRRYLCYTPCY